MIKIQEQIEEFHGLFQHPIGGFNKPTLIARDRIELRKKLIRSEAEETCDAIDAGDMLEVIDGVCDLIYVAVGALVEMGIDLEPFFNEVHRANMAKGGGGKDADGKTLKPAGWLPPDHERVLREQMARSVIGP